MYVASSQNLALILSTLSLRYKFCGIGKNFLLLHNIQSSLKELYSPKTYLCLLNPFLPQTGNFRESLRKP
jgi:hypothetical protein